MHDYLKQALVICTMSGFVLYSVINDKPTLIGPDNYRAPICTLKTFYELKEYLMVNQTLQDLVYNDTSDRMDFIKKHISIICLRNNLLDTKGKKYSPHIWAKIQDLNLTLIC